MQRLVDRTLLIDDSDIDLFIQRRFLEVYHFSADLQVCKSGEEALTFLRALPPDDVPDIIFLDLNMPECDGFSFLRQFSALPPTVQDKTKIVVLTSSNSSKDREQAFSFPNVIQFITKPLKQTDLGDLRELIAR